MPYTFHSPEFVLDLIELPELILSEAQAFDPNMDPELLREAIEELLNSSFGDDHETL
jgi:hypothetical protein